jgi:uncharacterized protein
MKGLGAIIQKYLGKLAKLQLRLLIPMILLMLVLTALLGIGLTKLEFESDFSNMNPVGPPITELTKKVSKDFRDTSTIVVAIELDDLSKSKFAPVDIRDPRIIEFLIRLDQNLNEEPEITNVISLGSIFTESGVPPNIESVKSILKHVPFTNDVVSSDYSFTTALVSADLGGDSKKIKEFSDRIDNIILQSSPPTGVKYITTGDAPLGAIIFSFIISDALKTSMIAIVLIFILLLLIQRSVRDAITILIPLIVGISWTFSLLGHLGIAINVGTAGLSAMLIGLGVEYNIFLVSRFKEERIKSPGEKGLVTALEESVSNIGASILSSGGTTVIGFMALSTSMFPILAGLGKSLGIGILMMFSSTILITPLVISIQEKLFANKQNKNNNLNENKTNEQKEGFSSKIYRSYGRAVSNHPWMFILLAFLILISMFITAQNLNNQDMDFENMLPEDNKQMLLFQKFQNEWGSTKSVIIYVEIDPSSPGTIEPIDIRDYRVLQYLDVLTQKTKIMEGVKSVSSLSEYAKNNNEGIIPKTIANNLETFENSGDLMSKDYSISQVKINIEQYVSNKELLRQVKDIVENTEKPVGLNVKVIGGIASEDELNALFGPDSNRTSLLALLGIVVFLYILSRSIKGTIIPITTVIFGVFWTIGLIGLFQVPFNNVTSSVITMTIGIGIDFGIQLLNRFLYEVKNLDKKKAMENTLTYVMSPMVITVVSAIIGFQAMKFGELNLMGDLGSTMSLAMLASMLAAITGVAAIIVLTHKDIKKS